MTRNISCCALCVIAAGAITAHSALNSATQADSGDVLNEKGDKDAALVRYKHSLLSAKSKGDSVRSLASISQVYYDIGNYSMAQLYLKDLKMVAPDSKWASKMQKKTEEDLENTVSKRLDLSFNHDDQLYRISNFCHTCAEPSALCLLDDEATEYTIAAINYQQKRGAEQEIASIVAEIPATQQRLTFNLEIPDNVSEYLSMVELRQLKTAFTKGRKARIRCFYCGASGSVAYVHDVEFIR